MRRKAAMGAAIGLAVLLPVGGWVWATTGRTLMARIE